MTVLSTPPAISRMFPSATPKPSAHTTGSLAALLKDSRRAELVGNGSLEITHLDAIDRARPGALTFIRNGAAAQDWAHCNATAALVARGVKLDEEATRARPLILVDDADLALIELLELFRPRAAAPAPGIHPTAVIDPTATVSPTASVGPWCVVGPNSVIGESCILVAQVYIGAEVSLGASTTLQPHVTVHERCTIGRGCLIHAGAVVGADGFGYRPSPDRRGVVKIPHIGTVEIGNGVEIGACVCIDRAKIGATTVGDGTKIDNLVQIGHGTHLGRSCLIAGQVGISGSVTIGDGVMLGGQVGVADNLTIGSGSKVAAKSGIMSDVPPNEEMWGLPARPAREARRDYAILLKLIEEHRAERLNRKRESRETGPE